MKIKEIFYIFEIFFIIFLIIWFTTRMPAGANVLEYSRNMCSNEYNIGTVFLSKSSLSIWSTISMLQTPNMQNNVVNLIRIYKDIQINTNIYSRLSHLSSKNVILKNNNTIYYYKYMEKPCLVNSVKFDDLKMFGRLILSVIFTISFLVVFVSYKRKQAKYNSLIISN